MRIFAAIALWDLDSPAMYLPYREMWEERSSTRSIFHHTANAVVCSLVPVYAETCMSRLGVEEVVKINTYRSLCAVRICGWACLELAVDAPIILSCRPLFGAFSDPFLALELSLLVIIGERKVGRGVRR